MTRAVTLLALLSAAAHAQTVTTPILSAQRQVTAYLPRVNSFDTSEALRQIAQRGRHVTLITTVAAVNDPNSYLIRLSHVPNVTTYLIRGTTGIPFILIDGQIAWAGAGLSDQGGRLQPVTNIATLNRWVSTVTRRPVPPLELLKLRYH